MTNREYAILIWGLIFLVFLIFNYQKNLLDIVKSVFIVTKTPIMRLIISINILFIIVVIYFSLKYRLGISFWYLKDYVITLLFTIFPIVIAMLKNSLSKLFKENIKDIFCVGAVVLFLTDTYTFSLVVELIIVLLLAVLSIVQAFSSVNKKYSSVEKMCSFLIIVIGFFILSKAVIQFFSNISDISTLDFWFSYAFEGLVLVLNFPILFIAQKMLYIEKIIAHSDYPNTCFSFLKYHVVRKIRLRRCKKIADEKENYKIVTEKFYWGYPKFIIELNSDIFLTKKKVLDIVAWAIIYGEKSSRLNPLMKYPIFIEIVDKKGNLMAMWKEKFISQKYSSYAFLDNMQASDFSENLLVDVNIKY
ncbi:hypothetical protein GPA00_02310 [Streptococcus equinus]|uniref:hypothetical protein n=1 Tax=Streptococcus equinus TaxID=1335 RepID=UPI0012F8DBC9|nr:hypothetical protein [Streptococcus equinus]QGX46014.1 hypothetical protein GPA00_02310 [Streptococcus equinus]